MNHGKNTRSCTRMVLCSIPFVVLIPVVFLHLTPDKDGENEKSTGSAPKPVEIPDASQLKYLHQDDPSLWKYIRTHHLMPPSTKVYNLDQPTRDSGTKSEENPGGGQNIIVKKILKNRRNGFFVEAGAYDGEKYSNTLSLERELNWTGLLVEGDPVTIPYLKKKHRKAWISDTCLSPSAKPQLVDFNHAVNYDIASKIGKPMNIAQNWTSFEVQCFPIYAILAAINVTVVDYFSLDVEGIEMQVLESIPFERLYIKVFSVEIQFLPLPDGLKKLQSFMESRNYRLVGQTLIDYIFAHISVLE